MEQVALILAGTNTDDDGLVEVMVGYPYGRMGLSWNSIGSTVSRSHLSNLNQNVAASYTVVANYAYDYVILSGPTTVTSPGDYTYTLSWSVILFGASGESWQIRNPSSNPFTVEVTLETSNGPYMVYYSTSVSCGVGHPYELGKNY